MTPAPTIAPSEYTTAVCPVATPKAGSSSRSSNSPAILDEGGVDRRRAVPELCLDPGRAPVEPAVDRDAAPCERRPGPDDDGVRPRLGCDGVERLRCGDPELAALPGCESPESVVGSELLAALVDQRPRRRLEPAPLEERPVVVAPR